ncbi:HAD family hydrolase [bacterium]|nr:HAD family hydrolase [bacterium]
MSFSAAVFDLFGTLIDNLAIDEYRMVTSEMAELLHVDPDRFHQFWVDEFPQRVRGIPATLPEGILAVCRLMGESPTIEAIQQAVDLRIEYSRCVLATRPYSCTVLAALRERGLKTALITDCTWEVPMLWEETAFAPLFDGTVFSCDEGTQKPDPHMYLTACRRIGAAPEDCLYVGDGASTELTGARAVGMTPVQILVPDESDQHYGRAFAQEWDGPVISHISQVLDWLDRQPA